MLLISQNLIMFITNIRTLCFFTIVILYNFQDVFCEIVADNMHKNTDTPPKLFENTNNTIIVSDENISHISTESYYNSNLSINFPIIINDYPPTESYMLKKKIIIPNDPKFGYSRGYVGKPSAEIMEQARKNVEKWTENSRVRPYEVSNYYEGDIFYAPRSIMEYNAMRDESKLWRNRTLVYSFHKTIEDDLRKLIKSSMADIMRKTKKCIKFREKTPEDKYYVQFQSFPRGCYSSFIGCNFETVYDEIQSINLQQNRCRSKNTIVHEILHTLGFYHEQNRPDRDKYVTILWKNIEPGKEINFKLFKDEIDTLNTEYDYKSIMHYTSYAFSKIANGPTILTVKNKTVRNSDHMTKLDSFKLKVLYNCPGYEKYKKNRPYISRRKLRSRSKSSNRSAFISVPLMLFLSTLIIIIHSS